MTTSESTGSSMKIGLILAAVIIVLRILLEQFGAPGMVNNVFGVAWLYFIFPLLFALEITSAGQAHPYKALFKKSLFFGLYTRLMVMVTYMAAYFLQWKAPRFSKEMGGVVGPDISFLSGFLLIPARNALVWIVFVIALGMIIGGITILIRKKKAPAATA